MKVKNQAPSGYSFFFFFARVHRNAETKNCHANGHNIVAMTAKRLKGKHNDKSSPFLCHYLVAMCTCIPLKKITIKEPFTLEIWAAKDLITSCCGAGFCGAADRVTAALVSPVNHTTVRVAMGSKRCVAAGHKNGGHLYSFQDPIKRKEMSRRTRDKWEPTDHSGLCSKHFEDRFFDSYSKLSVIGPWKGEVTS